MPRRSGRRRPECVQQADNGLRLVGGHRRVERYAELLAVDPLGYGQARSAPFGVAFLLVRRYGVMYHRAYSVVGEIALQGVAPRAHYGEYVVDAVTAILFVRDAQLWVRDVAHVIFGYAAALGVVVVKISQLHAQHGGLYLVETAVAPLHVEHVLAARPVVA